MPYSIKINFDVCDGGAECRDVCPQECFADPEEGKIVVKEDADCIGCEACVNSCPNNAITITEE